MIQSSRDHLDPHELEKGLSSPDQVYIRHEFTLTEQY
jgi:hypothetical protein